jgi:hypothetical protein
MRWRTSCILKNTVDGAHLRELSVDEYGSCGVYYEGSKWIKVAVDTVKFNVYFDSVYATEYFIMHYQLLRG